MLGAPLGTCQQTFLSLLAFMAFFSDFPGRSSQARCSRKASGASITLLRDGDSRVITRKKKESQLNELLHGDNVVHPLAGCCRQKFTLGCSGEVLMPRGGADASSEPCISSGPQPWGHPCPCHGSAEAPKGVAEVLQGGIRVRGTSHLLSLWSRLARLSSIARNTLPRGEIPASVVAAAPQLHPWRVKSRAPWASPPSSSQSFGAG